MADAVHARLTPGEGRRFAFTLGAAFFVLAGIALWRGKQTTATVCAALGGVLLLAGLAVPSRLGPVQRGWMGFAHALSKVTTPIFLGVLYFGVIAPAGFVLRLFGKKPLQPAKTTETCWVAREPDKAAPDQMQHQF